jgi:hypothetical protein
VSASLSFDRLSWLHEAMTEVVTWHCGRHGDLVGCQREVGGGITLKQEVVVVVVVQYGFKLRLNVIFVTNKYSLFISRHTYICK